MDKNIQLPEQEQDGNNPDMPKFRKNQTGFSTAVIMHIVLLAAIVIIFAVCAYKLYKWNKGVPSDYDPNDITTDFDIEPLDSIIPLAKDKLEGHADDGKTTILCLGNDPFSKEKGQDNGLAEMIEARVPDPENTIIYNGSFNGSTMSAAFMNYNDGYWMDSFSLPYLAKAICTRDFAQVLQSAYYSYDPDFVPTVEMLEGLDMDSVDIICIMYDAIDYIEKRPTEDPNDPESIITYTGALRTAIKDIQEAYPFIRIVVMSHTFCFSINEEGNFQNGDRADLGNGTISHYLQKELDVTSDCSVSWIDNFYGSINEDNYLDYMTDYIHFNDEGRKLLADRFVECILPTETENE